VTVVMDQNAPTYRQLLEEAEELGRADGLLSAAFEPPRSSAGFGQRCLGRTPAEFAALVWEAGRARPEWPGRAVKEAT
jgi:hypothetical protein